VAGRPPRVIAQPDARRGEQLVLVTDRAGATRALLAQLRAGGSASWRCRGDPDRAASAAAGTGKSTTRR